MSARERFRKAVNSKHMLTSIGIASFLESTIVPIPLETILVPLMQARREKLWQIATVTTFGCVFGSILGYGVGFFLFDLSRDWIMSNLTTEAQFDIFKQQINENGFLFVFSTGVTPIPLQIGMLVAGVTGYSLGLYILAVTLSRCIRYFGIALLVKYFGNRTEKIIRKYKWQVGFGALLVVLAVVIFE